MSVPLREAYELLFARYGPQDWWPGETPFEVIVGAVLTQNTAWSNVQRAIDNLREANALSLQTLNQLQESELAELIRPAGYFRLKSRRLRNLTKFVQAEFGSVERMFRLKLDDLRERLLVVNGIGPETADSILLYAGQFTTFVVDTYTARIVTRHGWIDSEAGYYQIKSLFEDGLEANQQLFNEYHALVVRVGKEHCKKQPLCEQCPLADLLPEGGPL